MQRDVSVAMSAFMSLQDGYEADLTTLATDEGENMMPK